MTVENGNSIAEPAFPLPPPTSHSLSGRKNDTVHLDRAGAMDEETVRFYVAELAMAIDYLHEKRIVHR